MQRLQKVKLTRKLCYRKDDRAMRNIWTCLKQQLEYNFLAVNFDDHTIIIPKLIFLKFLTATFALVSPKFPHVPLGVGRWPLATKNEGVGLVRAISFQGFHQMWSWFTVRQTDRQTTCNRKTALCTMVHRAVYLSSSLTARHLSPSRNISIKTYLFSLSFLEHE